MSTLSENINQSIEDFDAIKEAIFEKGVDVPDGTPTSEYAEKILQIEGGISPSGTIDITENNLYDVASYAQAAVNVPKPSGTIEIEQNGTHDVTNYAQAAVNVPETNPVAKSVIGTDIEELEIPEGIAEIASYALANRDSLISVTIPEGVTSIADFAFYDCNNLETVVLPSTLVTIGKNAFANCNKLQFIQFNEGLQDIQESAFENCSSLSDDLIFPSTLQHIGYHAFYCCSNLHRCNITNLSSWCDVTIDGGDLPWYYGIYLNGEPITILVIPDGVTEISESAFNRCNSIESITIPDSVVSIGSGAFNSVSNVVDLSIGSGLENLEDDSFGAFSNCTEISVSPDNPTFDSRNNCNAIIDTATNTLIKGCGTTIIPEDILHIGPNAFAGCSNLTSIEIPNSVETIESSAFIRCSNLTSIVIPDSVTFIGERAFSECSNLSSVTLSESIDSLGEGTFSSCTKLTHIDLPEGIRELGDYCFSCSRLSDRTLTLPSTLEVIGNACFLDVFYIAHVDFPEGLLRIGDYAFEGCINLCGADLPDSLISVGRGAFVISNLYYVNIGKNLTYIGNDAFASDKLREITVSESNSMFAARNNHLYNKDFSKLVYRSLKNSYDEAVAGVKIIGEYACTQLRGQITIPDTVVAIETGAFNYSSFTSVILGSGVKQIADNAFSHCQSLADVYYKGSEADWNIIEIGSNEYLTNATIHYNYIGE